MNRLLALLTAAFILPALIHADEAAPPSKFYRLVFVVQEVEGARVINTREYSTVAACDTPQPNASIRATASGTYEVVKSGTTTLNQQYNVGLNIDMNRMQETQGGLSLNLQVEFVSIPTNSGSGQFANVRKNNWGGTLLVPLKKQTLVFSSDDLASKSKIELLLTVAPLK